MTEFINDTLIPFVKENPFIAVWVGVVVLFIVFAIVANIMKSKQRLQVAQDYLEKHPDAAKVLLKGHNYLIFYKVIRVSTVDGEKPAFYKKGSKYGIYLSPGKHTIDALCETHRPGIIHRTVTKTYGPAQLNINATASAEYTLEFKKREFKLEQQN